VPIIQRLSTRRRNLFYPTTGPLLQYRYIHTYARRVACTHIHGGVYGVPNLYGRVFFSSLYSLKIYICVYVHVHKDDTTADCIARAPYLASPVSIIIIIIIYYACIILIISKPLQANDPAASNRVSISTFFSPFDCICRGQGRIKRLIDQVNFTAGWKLTSCKIWQ